MSEARLKKKKPTKIDTAGDFIKSLHSAFPRLRSSAPGRSGAGPGHPLPRAAPTLIYSHLFLAAEGCLPRFDGDSPVCCSPGPEVIYGLPLNFSPAAPGTPRHGQGTEGKGCCSLQSLSPAACWAGGREKTCQEVPGNRTRWAWSAWSFGVFLGGPTEGWRSRPRVTEREPACLTITIIIISITIVHCPSAIHQGNIFQQRSPA